MKKEKYSVDVEQCKDAVDSRRGKYDANFLKLLKKECDKNTDIIDDINGHPAAFMKYNDIYNDAIEGISHAKTGNAIYRGLSIDRVRYNSFVNGLTHRGFTLEKYLGIGDYRHPDAGVYWTWDEDCARESGGCEKKITEDLVILVGKNPDKIDDDGTILTNFEYWGDEKEVRLAKGSTVLLTKICRHVKHGKGKKAEFEQICEPFNKRIRV